MKGTDVTCPECGAVNKSLFLEETEGNYECERCGYRGKVEGYDRRILIIRAGDIEEKARKLTPLMA